MKEKIYIILITFALVFSSCQETTRDINQNSQVRIVSLVPSLTDFVCKINPESLVAVSNYCDASCLPDSIARVGGYGFLDYEKIAALQPTKVLVLKGFSSSEQIKRLKELNIEVQFFTDSSLADVLAIPVQIDSILGKALSEELINKLKTLEANKVKGSPTYLTMISNEPIQVYGQQNYLSELFGKIGFVNQAKDLKGSYPTIQSEYFVKHLPEYIITSDTLKTKKILRHKYQEVLTQERINQINFVQIDANQLSRSGPQVLENAKDLLGNVSIE